MAGRCTICARTDREDIEVLMISGVPYRTIAAQHGCSASALSRHSRGHLTVGAQRRADAIATARAESLGDRLEMLYERAERILTEAEKVGAHNVALAGIKELRGILEFAAKLATVPPEPVTIRLTFSDGRPASPPWLPLPQGGEEA